MKGRYHQTLKSNFHFDFVEPLMEHHARQMNPPGGAIEDKSPLRLDMKLDPSILEHMKNMRQEHTVELQKTYFLPVGYDVACEWVR
jgi:hypothetical protein